MKRKIIAISILMTLVICSTFASANVVNNKEKTDKDTSNKSSLHSFGEVVTDIKYGQETFYRYGDVRDYDASHLEGGSKYAIRMGEDVGTWHGWACYEFFIEEENIEDYLEIGIQWCDHGWIGNGPSIYIKKVEDGLYYKKASNIGDQDQFKWKWITIDEMDKYVRDSDGRIHIMVETDGLDDSIVDEIGIKYEKSLANLHAEVESPLSWSNVKPGETRTGKIYIENDGDPNSKLDWKILETLDWVSCSPDRGLDLPQGSIKTVTVTVTAPSKKGENLGGTIKVFNTNNPDDKALFNVGISTKSKNLERSLFLDLLERFPLLQRLLNL